MNHDPIIVALDLSDADQARALVQRLGNAVSFYKIGMELYAAAGMNFACELADSGKRVFLDLKMYDIPETIKRAVKQVAKTDVEFLTVHARLSVMQAAMDGRGTSSLKLLGVSVLTSMDEQDLLIDTGYPARVSELVALRSRNAMAAGVDGIVCSPLDVGAVRGVTGNKAILVTPGVRSRAGTAMDQKRVATPAEAVAAGADYLVIGREVTRANDPVAEIERIHGEIEAGSRMVTPHGVA
ncbi:MAG TPA: orotidine-5'-phosphate decarboxylase [Bryobacteraceae bacterium]|nr:orotidine-5'-phosphate decarboxylase [Bryobacteraceae bacterium]